MANKLNFVTEASEDDARVFKEIIFGLKRLSDSYQQLCEQHVTLSWKEFVCLYNDLTVTLDNDIIQQKRLQLSDVLSFITSINLIIKKLDEVVQLEDYMVLLLLDEYAKQLRVLLLDSLESLKIES